MTPENPRPLERYAYATISTVWATKFKDHEYSMNIIGGKTLTIAKDGKRILTMNDATGNWIGRKETGELITIEWIPLLEIVRMFEVIQNLENVIGWKVISKTRNKGEPSSRQVANHLS